MAHTDPNAGAHGYDIHGHPLQAGEHPERHEHSDVPTRPLMMFLITMLVLAVVMHIGLWLLFDVYEGAERRRDELRIRSAVARDRLEKLPPEPRIQGVPTFHPETPRDDTIKMKRENAKVLSSEGTNADGSVRIPIERAMEIVVQRGLPTTRPSGQGGQSAK